ncbi:unnamed protein product [Peronospora belbahrii]|uniref:Uncharacterized protein n=1 Tax=Peronospora belbahrii TaxID=622444 RepID=A0AAU9KKZ2_9STRA|nr:unnamed protein product [Peronospora belbahrii]CAH0514501.1 unnamed protein product [Peronospora belbahrii]
MRQSVVLLLVALATITSAQSSSSGSTFVSIFANSTSFNSSAYDSSLSQCEVCRDTGDCSKAYNGVAGKLCNLSLDPSNSRRACCCPASDVCLSDNTCGIFIAVGKRRILQRDGGNGPDGVGTAYAQYSEGGQGAYTLHTLLTSDQGMVMEAIGMTIDGMGTGSTAVIGTAGGLLGGLLFGEAIGDISNWW